MVNWTELDATAVSVRGEREQISKYCWISRQMEVEQGNHSSQWRHDPLATPSATSTTISTFNTPTAPILAPLSHVDLQEGPNAHLCQHS